MHFRLMLEILGSSAPLFPSTGHFVCRDEQHRWTENNLTHWNAYFTVSGSWEFFLDDKAHTIGPGDFLLFSPRVVRAYRVPAAAGECEFYWMHFRPSAVVQRAMNWFGARTPWQVHHVADPGLSVRLAAVFDEMNQFNVRHPTARLRDPLVGSLVDSVLLRLAAATERTEWSGPGGIDPRVQKAIEHIHRNLTAVHTIPELARSAGLSRSQFCALFRAGLGRSPTEYVEERRLELARFYLATTTQTVAQIAARTGFESPFYFSRRFRLQFGCSPRGFRGAAPEPAGTSVRRGQGRS
jgi:AraC family transcriptional regulator of arabinose operon